MLLSHSPCEGSVVAAFWLGGLFSLSVASPFICVRCCSTSLTRALKASGAQAQCKLYKGKTHTDLIVQVRHYTLPWASLHSKGPERGRCNTPSPLCVMLSNMSHDAPY